LKNLAQAKKTIDTTNKFGKLLAEFAQEAAEK